MEFLISVIIFIIININCQNITETIEIESIISSANCISSPISIPTEITVNFKETIKEIETTEIKVIYQNESLKYLIYECNKKKRIRI